MSKGHRKISLLACTLFSMGGCVSIAPEQRTDTDPWEGINRSVYIANTALDNATLKPLSKGYRKITPNPVRKGISNFFRNLGKPASAANNFLQGKARGGFSELGRFFINSTVGLGGLIDVASASGMQDYPEDFGQTLAVWGVPDGPYVMLPFLGPKTLRDALTLPVDIAADPLSHYDNTSVRDRLYGLRLIDLRYRLLTVEKLLDDSKDAYVTTRESYLQNREYKVYDGDPPEDEEFFEEFLDEE